jgi:hypothetical protein
MKQVGDTVIETINDINLEVIIEYCKEKGEIDWLKSTINEEVAPDKRGRNRKKSFIELRKEFVIKFMPEFAPMAQPKKPSMYDIINAL